MTTIRNIRAIVCCVLITLCSTTAADEPTLVDVVYSTAGEIPLKLDFYKPTRLGPQRPLLIWIHGGAWRSGSKADVPVMELRQLGFAIASVDYRLSPVAKFPAQIHDIKAAIAYLRLNAEQLGVDPQRFVLAGASAGGHLAALAAVTDGVSKLNGSQGTEAANSKVQAVVSFYGASNLRTILAQSTPFGINMRVPALELFLGGLPEQQPELARLASPVEHIDAGDPPLWLYHGDQDPQMPINQAHELVGVYKKVGLPVELDVVYGAAHGGKIFYISERIQHLGEELLAAMDAERPAIRRDPTSTNALPNSDPIRVDPSEGKKAKIYQLTLSDLRNLPEIKSFRDQPTEQFIVPWEVYRTGHPFLGSAANKPHTGGHLYFHAPEKSWAPSQPEHYPPILAFADGVVTRVDEAFRLQPVYFPSLGITRANIRYGVDIAFARAGDRPVSFHYSIEPMVDPGDLDFYCPFLLVAPGQRVRKGETIARMYLPPNPADNENSHIHFNLICERQFQSPSIFNPAVVEKFAARWDQQRLREDWPIPPCMGWRLDEAEDPFESR